MTTVLAGKRILVAEDSYLIAQDLSLALREAGAIVLGPAPSVRDCRALLENPIDAAVLDVRLADGDVTPVAKLLLAMSAPVVIVTALPSECIPAELVQAPVLEKPLSAQKIVETVARLVAGNPTRPVVSPF